MRCGLEKKGWSLKFANDIDEQKCEIYNANFEDGKSHLVCGDIHELDVATIPTVTLATASFHATIFHWQGRVKGFTATSRPRFGGLLKFSKRW